MKRNKNTRSMLRTLAKTAACLALVGGGLVGGVGCDERELLDLAQRVIDASAQDATSPSSPAGPEINGPSAEQTDPFAEEMHGDDSGNFELEIWYAEF